jgi:bifunctional DNA-binding transcriptional regulator/antitoxin component of YhaV-PrlF toxin-antitoxin module
MAVTVNNKSALAAPTDVQRRAGIKAGDRVDFKVSGSIITIVPELPDASDEYTPQQRRVIDAQLAEGLEDIRKGRVSPKFNTVDEMLASLNAKPTHQKKARTKSR